MYACLGGPGQRHRRCPARRPILHYNLVYAALREDGITRLHSPEAHLRASDLPRWYPRIEDLTPRRVRLRGGTGRRRVGYPSLPGRAAREPPPGGDPSVKCGPISFAVRGFGGRAARPLQTRGCPVKS
jgi:hypothetical protein